MTRAYKRDRKGRFAATPGAKVAVSSALDEAQAALDRAEHGVDQIVKEHRATQKRRSRTVRRHAVAGVALGAVVPAPPFVKVTATGANLFAATSATAGAKIGKTVGKAKVNRQAGKKLRR